MSGVYTYEDRVSFVGLLDVDGTTPVTFAPGRPINIRRVILVVATETLQAVSTVTVAVRNVDDTSSVTKGTFITPASGALNTVFKVDVANVKTAATIYDSWGISQPATVTTGRVNGVQANTPGEIQVNPGQEISFTADGVPTQGMLNLYIEYSEMGNNPTRYNATDIAFTAA